MKRFANLTSWSSLSILNDSVYPKNILQQLVPKNKAFDYFYPELKELYIRRYGYFLLSEEELLSLGMFLHHKTVLEVGSGTGWLSYQLKRIGVKNLYTVDNGSAVYDNVFSRDFYCDISDIVKDIWKYDAILLAMPELDESGRDISIEIAENMVPGQILIYLGETRGGCNAGVKFFDYVKEKNFLPVRQDINRELNSSHIRWLGIHEQWHVLAR